MSSDLLIHYKSVNEPVKHIRLSSRSQQQRQSWKMVRFLFYIFTISTTYYICAHLTIWHIKCISVSSLFVKSLRNFEFLFCHKFTRHLWDHGFQKFVPSFSEFSGLHFPSWFLIEPEHNYYRSGQAGSCHVRPWLTYLGCQMSDFCQFWLIFG